MLNIQPKEKQELALNMLRQNWKQNRTFLLYAPVGYGKTAVAAFIADGFVSRGMRVMFVAPYTILVDQTSTRFIEYGIDPDEISFVWRDHPSYDPSKLVQIASADTLIRREFPDNVDLLIVDEAHMRRRKLLEIIRDSGVKVIGLSGTPFAKFMGNYYEKLIKPTTMRQLIESGDLSNYEFYAPTKPDLSNVKSQYTESFGSDYNEEQLSEIMCGADLVGNVVQNWLTNGENLQTVCFCVNVKHANFITIEFNKNGVSAEVMTAGTPHEERQLIIRRFEQGITKVLVNVGVLVAGFDSDVRCIIYARPTKSEIRWIQCLGRGLRSAPGKEQCKIFDHSGSVHRLGFPDSIEYDELSSKEDGMKKAKRSDQDREEKLPKECTECHYIKPAGVYVCPKCGFKPLFGDDVDTDETRGLKRLKSVKEEPTLEDKQNFWSQVKYFQNERESQGKPLSDGWVANLYKRKFGVWPRGLHDSIKEISPEVRNYIRSSFIAYAKSKARTQSSPEARV